MSCLEQLQKQVYYISQLKNSQYSYVEMRENAVQTASEGNSTWAEVVREFQR